MKQHKYIPLNRVLSQMARYLFALGAAIFLDLAATAVATAEDAVIVKDLNTNPRALDISARCTSTNAEFLFANDGIRGTELWVGNGLSGTRLVRDIYVGAASGLPNSQCASLGNILIFAANDGATGNEIWTSDGTQAGTVILKDIYPGASGSSPGSIVKLGSKVLFTANDGTNGTELWITDGTAAGTLLVKDIYGGAGSSSPSSIVAVSDTLAIFAAGTSAEGVEIWKTDGTEAGTQIIKDIRSGSSGSFPQGLTLLGNSVFFSASTAANGREPWITDGTDAGTTILADLNPGSAEGFSFNGKLQVVNGTVLFTGRTATSGYELFGSNGTPSGTGIVKDIEPGSSGSFPSSYSKVGARVIFSASTSAAGREPYVSDGTTAGTTIISDINPGAGDGTDLSPVVELVDHSKIIFSGGIVSSSTQQLYSWDDTNLTLLTDLFPGAPGVSGLDFSAATSKGVPVGYPNPAASFPGPGYVVTDGTVSGTKVHPGSLSGYTESSSAIPMAELNGKLLFAASDRTTGLELWSTDGTDSGTSRITDINEGIGASIIPTAGFAVLNGKLLFVASNSAYGAELWITDGTTAGTSLLKDIESGVGSAFSAGSAPSRKFYVVGSKVVFAANTTAAGTELWATDGTADGTSMISDIKAGAGSALPEGLIIGAVSSSSLGPTLFFVADDGTHGGELWATTTAVTGITSDIVTGSSGSSPASITPLPVPGGYLGVVFRACATSTGCEVFISTGGAPSVIDVVPGATGSNPEQFTFLSEDKLFFVGETAATGSELMQSTFPFSSAAVVKDIASGAADSNITGLTRLNSTNVFFSACSTPTGLDCEPWKSDGTSIGTLQIKDINAGTESSFFGYSGARVLNDVAYFQAVESDSIESVRYYRSDGTSSGTYALTSQGFKYFSTDGLPSPFTSALGTLFFPAFSSSYGLELFKIGEDQCPSDASKSIPALCGCGVAETDTDGDGAVDCIEQCPLDSMKQSVGACGCGAVETDTDSDGTADCIDQCPADPLKSTTGACGCGATEADLNGNGVADCTDAQLPLTTPRAAKIQFRKKSARITLIAINGVTYELSYAVGNKGTKLKNIKFKKKTSASTPTSVTLPPHGKSLFVKYRYVIKGTKLISKFSPVSKKYRR